MKNKRRKAKQLLVLVLSVAMVLCSMDLTALTVSAQEGSMTEEAVVQDTLETVSANETGSEDTKTVAEQSVSDGTVVGEEEEIETLTLEEWYELSPTETSAVSTSLYSLADGNVELISGTAVNWIERLNLSGTEEQVIREFYDMLVEASDNDGENDWLIDDSYLTSDYSVIIAEATGTVASEDEFASTTSAVAQNYLPYVRAAFDAFDRDHPEVFWLSGATSCGYSASASGNDTTGWNYTVKIKFCVTDNTNSFDMRDTSYQSQSAIETAITARNERVEELVSAASSMSTVEKIQYFNEQLTTTNEYNTSSNLNNIGHDCRECTGALAGKTGTDGPVCEAYARAFKVLCDEAGIPCVLVDGYARTTASASGEAHMWNYVQVNGRWYGVDVTWNDPMVSGITGAVSGYENEKWLLVGSATEIGTLPFIESHPVANRVSVGGIAFTNGPTLSEEKYSEDTSEASITITSQPESKEVDYGYIEQPELSVEAVVEAGVSINYQWQEATVTGGIVGEYTDIAGANENSYSVPIGKNAGVYSYRCVLSSGDETICSEAATLTVNKAVMTGITVTPGKSVFKIQDTSDNLYNISLESLGGIFESGVTAYVRVYKDDAWTEWMEDSLQPEENSDLTTYYSSHLIHTYTEGAGNVKFQVKITGADGYTDWISEEFTAECTPFDLNGAEVSDTSYFNLASINGTDTATGLAYCYYTGNAIVPVLQMQIEDENGVLFSLASNENAGWVTFEYDDNTNPGTATLTVIGNGEDVIGSRTYEFLITYYSTEAVATVSSEGWTNKATINAPEGFKISQNLEGTYAEFLDITVESLSAEGTEITYYLKQDDTDYITDGKTITVKVDTTAPVFTEENCGIKVSVRDAWWQELLNTITFGTYKAQKVTIHAEDALSGECQYYYYVDITESSTALTIEELDIIRENNQFTKLAGDSFSMNTSGSYVIYAYAIDGAGNRSGYISTDGVIIDTVKPEFTVTDKPSESADKAYAKELCLEANEAGKYYYILKTDEESAPESFEDFATEEDGVWTAKEGVQAGAFEESEAYFTASVLLEGLTPNVEYIFYAVATDAVGNVSDIVSYEFKTDKKTPVFEEDSISVSGTYGQKLKEMTINAPIESIDGVSGAWTIDWNNNSDKYDTYLAAGEHKAYIVFTPDDMENYETVEGWYSVNVTKKSVTVTVQDVSRKYGEENPAFTYSYTEEDFVGDDTADDLAVTLETNATTASPVKEGGYSITGTSESKNYNVTVVPGKLTINKADAVISIESGKENYNKTFGDADFLLEGITENSDDKNVQYEVTAGADVVSVADGIVTILTVGTATITLYMPESDNYNAAESKTVTINIVKKPGYTVESINRSYLYSIDSADTVDLTKILPNNYGTVSYDTPVTDGDIVFDTEPSIKEGILSYTVKNGNVNTTGTIKILVTTQHYVDFIITVNLMQSDKVAVKLQEGSEVTLKNNTLTYGEALSNLIFCDAVFVDIAGKEVDGILGWKDATIIPDVGTTNAAWVFTPASEEYASLEGSVSIVVEPAKGVMENKAGDAGYQTEYVYTGNTVNEPVASNFTVSSGNTEITYLWYKGECTGESDVLAEENRMESMPVNAGIYTLVAVTPATGNYTEAELRLKITVTPKTITVEAENKSKIYGEENPNLTFVYNADDLAENDTVDALAVTLRTGAVRESAVGEYEITGESASCNYAVTVIPAKLTITQAQARIIIADGKTDYKKNYGDDSFILEGIYTVGDGTLMYTLSDGKDVAGQPKAVENILTVSADGKAAIQGSGSVTITVSMGETTNYKAAESQQIRVQIARRDGFYVGETGQHIYSGKAIEPDVPVFDGGIEKRLEKGKDYTISYKNNVKAYTYEEGDAEFNSAKAPQIIIKGKGNYSQKLIVYFTIQPKDISEEDVTVNDIVLEQNEKQQKKVPVITYNKKKLSGVAKPVEGQKATKIKDFVYSYPELEAEESKNSAFKENGTYRILVEGTGNYTGSRIVNLTITGKGTRIDKAVIKKIPEQFYNAGNPVELDETELVVTVKAGTLTKDVDYVVSYKDNTEAGTATVIVTGIGDYAGTKKAFFKIVDKRDSLKKAEISGIENKIYFGSEQAQESLNITLKGNTLTEGTDYTVTYVNHKNVGTASMIIQGIGDYTGTVKKTFKITAYDLKNDTDEKLGGLEKDIQVSYLKGGCKPEVSLTFNNTELIAGQDYTISYQNNKNVATAKTKKAPAIVIKGKGNFKGTVTKTFTITAKSLNDSELPVTMTAPDKAVSKKSGGYISKPILIDTDGTVLKVGKDYSTPVYTMLDESGNTIVLNKADKVEAGREVTVTVCGMGAYEGGELSVNYRITEKDFGKVKVKSIQKAYTGGEVTLTAEDFTNADGISKVNFGSKADKAELVYGKDFEIVEGSYKNNIKKGTASVTIKGLGEYGGTKTIKFKIGTKEMFWWWQN